ncbi:MAG TPA: mycofactocin biosynthesis peptidyl-dipeptidase MftE [Acidimicrobiales bacterium]|nr:mycofactocin biosynthesis peptidyl-dipeptidase MftE [Acidimicrobiales bacterium]
MSASRLRGLAWPDVPTGVLAVPVGSTEQHGPHLPVTTDTDIAEAIVNGLSDRRPDVIVAPAVSYGSSGEHAGFAGTLSIGQEATEQVLVELGRSGADSFGRTLLISTHGGNADPVNRAVSRLRAEGRDVRAWAPRWEGDAHAGRVETSVMLAVAPDRVALDRATPGNTQSLAELLPVLSTSGTRAVSENGVLGDPTGASANEGRRLLDAAIDELEAMVIDWMHVLTSTPDR